MLKWIITSLVIISSGAATVSFGIEMWSRLPVTLATDENFYLEELPEVGAMVEDYLDIEAESLLLRNNSTLSLTDDFKIKYMRFVVAISAESRETYTITYENEQISIQEGRSIGFFTEPVNFDVALESLSLYNVDLSLTDYAINLNSNFSDGITFFGLSDAFYYDGSVFHQVTTDMTGLFVQFYVSDEQDESLVGTYFVPVGS